MTEKQFILLLIIIFIILMLIRKKPQVVQVKSNWLKWIGFGGGIYEKDNADKV